MAKPRATPRDLVAFVSSTYLDLQPYRNKVEEALARIEASFRSMKFFGSKEGDPLEVCLVKLRQCNLYIGIVGHRYGTVHEASQLSFTELEYEEAKRLGMARCVYVADSTIPIEPNQIEPDSVRKQLEVFKQKVKKENNAVPFHSPDDLALKVVCDIFLNSSVGDEIVTFAETKYLPAVRRSSASISFLGLDIQSMKRHKDVKLEKVYVQPRFLITGSESDITVPAGAVPGESAFIATRSEVSKTVTLAQVISEDENLVILGDPGSGKSTLTKFLVVSLIDEKLKLETQNRRLIPIKISLRAYSEFRSRSGGIGITILDFVKAITKTELQRSELPDGFFEFFLEKREAFIIFDGLDEIFDTHLREQIRNDIASFSLVSFPGNRTVITSRIVGYDETGFQQPDFVHVQIGAFDDHQISEYIDKWYELEESDKRKRESEVVELKRAVANLPRELLSNPLLLSLIVILFRSGCTLPDSKLEIYRSCVGTLTEKWDAAGKRLELPTQYNLVRDKKSALARIAYWMYR